MRETPFGRCAFSRAGPERGLIVAAASRRHRGVGWVVVQGVLLATTAVVTLRFRRRGPRLLERAGAAALLAYGAWSGVAGLRSLGRNLTPLPGPREGGELITSGIYAQIRHPLYASMMAAGFGWALAWGSRVGLVPAAVLMLFLHAKARHEEQLLHARFAGYSGYSARVPRYVPLRLAPPIQPAQSKISPCRCVRWTFACQAVRSLVVMSDCRALAWRLRAVLGKAIGRRSGNNEARLGSLQKRSEHE
jgi:protein-S-isoprenylcysteine O-methyltransferase Ste14